MTIDYYSRINDWLSFYKCFISSCMFIYINIVDSNQFVPDFKFDLLSGALSKKFIVIRLFTLMYKNSTQRRIDKQNLYKSDIRIVDLSISMSSAILRQRHQSQTILLIIRRFTDRV